MKFRPLFLVLILSVLLCGAAAAQDEWIPAAAETQTASVTEWNEPDSPLLALTRADGLIYMDDIDAPLRDFLQQKARCVFESLRPSQLMSRLTWVKAVDLSPYEGTLSDARWLWMFESLETLTLTDATLADLTVIGSFTSLTELTLLNCGVFDLSPLLNCPDLGALSLGWDDDYLGASGAFDLTPLAELDELTTLRLYGGGITTLDALSPMVRRLRTLTLSDTAIADFSLLAKFTKLTSLTLDLLPSADAAAAMQACSTSVKELTLGRIILDTDVEDAAKCFSKLTDYTLTDCDAADALFYENLPKSTRLTMTGVTVPGGETVQELYADKTTMVLRGAPEAMMLYMLDTRSSNLKILTIELDALSEALDDELRQKTSLNTLSIGLNADVDLTGDAWGRITGVSSLTIYSKGYTLLSTDFLSALINVRTLTLSGVRIDNSAGIGELRLTQLNVYGCRIADWSFLQNLTGMSIAKIYGSQLTNDALPYLASLAKLDALHLNGNAITDIADLIESTSLRKLDILDNPISDYTPLLFMSALRTVYSDQHGVITDNSILVRSVYIDEIDYETIEQEAFGGDMESGV